jgi:hypothetical protein
LALTRRSIDEDEEFRGRRPLRTKGAMLSEMGHVAKGHVLQGKMRQGRNKCRASCSTRQNLLLLSRLSKSQSAPHIPIFKRTRPRRRQSRRLCACQGIHIVQIAEIVPHTGPIREGLASRCRKALVLGELGTGAATDDRNKGEGVLIGTDAAGRRWRSGDAGLIGAGCS